MRFTLLILLFACSVSYSQDTVKLFLDDNYMQTKEASATLVRQAVIGSDYYLIQDYNLDGEMINSVTCSSIDPWIENGYAKHFTAPDLIYSEGEYLNGYLIGKWSYYAKGESITVNYLPQQDYFKNTDCPKSLYYDKKKDTKIIGDKVLDSLDVYLNRNFNMPARALGNFDQFVLYINFTLDTDGKIKCPELPISFHKDISSEIYRLLKDFNYKADIKKAIHFTTTFPYNSSGAPSDIVYQVVEKMPLFTYNKCQSSGIDCFTQYVMDKLETSSVKCQGNVYIQFIVNKSGKIEDFQVIRGNESCEQHLKDIESIIVSSPLWQPGEEKGKPANVQFTMPLIFE
jgi:hypothetical protein